MSPFHACSGLILIVYSMEQHLGLDHFTIPDYYKTFIALILGSLLGHFYYFSRYMTIVPLQTAVNCWVVNRHHSRKPLHWVFNHPNCMSK